MAIGRTNAFVCSHVQCQNVLLFRAWHPAGGGTSALVYSHRKRHNMLLVCVSCIVLCSAQGRMSKDEAESLIKQMQLEGRYQRDVW